MPRCAVLADRPRWRVAAGARCAGGTRAARSRRRRRRSTGGRARPGRGRTGSAVGPGLSRSSTSARSGPRRDRPVRRADLDDVAGGRRVDVLPGGPAGVGLDRRPAPAAARMAVGAGGEHRRSGTRGAPARGDARGSGSDGCPERLNFAQARGAAGADATRDASSPSPHPGPARRRRRRPGRRARRVGRVRQRGRRRRRIRRPSPPRCACSTRSARSTGCRRFSESAVLDKAAAAYARRMVADASSTTSRPTAGRSWTASRPPAGPPCGSWTAGENIAWGSGSLGTPASIVDSWMHCRRPPRQHPQRRLRRDRHRHRRRRAAVRHPRRRRHLRQRLHVGDRHDGVAKRTAVKCATKAQARAARLRGKRCPSATRR